MGECERGDAARAGVTAAARADDLEMENERTTQRGEERER